MKELCHQQFYRKPQKQHTLRSVKGNISYTIANKWQVIVFANQAMSVSLPTHPVIFNAVLRQSEHLQYSNVCLLGQIWLWTGIVYEHWPETTE